MIYQDSNETRSTESYHLSISFFEYLCVFVLIIYAGSGNTFFESGSFKENPIGVFLPIMLCGILILRWKVKFDAYFYILIIGFSFYFVAISIKDGEFHPSFFLNYFLKFFTVYTFIKALKSNLFKIFEHVLYYLAIIGLFMWIIQILLRDDTLLYYFNKIPGIGLFSNITGGGLNVLIYSVQPSSFSIIHFMIPRNCGYTQEPGCFAVYLCLAIFINLFIANSDKRSRKRFLVLMIALLSTMSTTGYLIFILIIVFYILGRELNKALLLFPVAIIALIYISTLPFMSNKIIDLVNETNTMDQMIVSTIGQEEDSTPQRFTSFMITFVDFRNNPILGLGPDNDKSWVNKIGAKIAPISGIGNLLAQFGIVGFIFFIISSVRSSFFFSKCFKYKGKFLLFLIIIFISISYSIVILPLLMCFWMFNLFAPTDVNQDELTNLDLNTQNNVGNP
jgi:O-Antigen ligase